MNRFAEYISADEQVQLVRSLADTMNVTAYLVGGGVRDLLLGRKVKDLDFALSGAPEVFPRAFAERIGGTFFWLDRERGQSRVVARREEGPFTFDFAPLRGGDIGSDLLLRDFTINGMALELVNPPVFIDPLNGADDVRNRLIRRCSDYSLDDDPLRLLRAIRLAATLGFSVEDGTWRDIERKGRLLAQVAAERVRDELFQILAAPRLGLSLQMLCDSGLMAFLIPETLGGELTAVTMAQPIAGAIQVEKTAEELGRYFPDHAQRVHDLLAREIEGGITALSLVKLAAFSREAEGLGKADVWATSLRLGKRATRMLALLTRDMAAVFASLAKRATPRAMFRFFKDHDPAGVELVLHALAQGEVSQRLCAELIRYYLHNFDPAEDEFLLSGEEVMRILGTGEGPEVGSALERLRAAESLGIVNSREEAEAFLRKNLLTKGEAIS